MARPRGPPMRQGVWPSHLGRRWHGSTPCERPDPARQVRDFGGVRREASLVWGQGRGRRSCPSPPSTQSTSSGTTAPLHRLLILQFQPAHAASPPRSIERSPPWRWHQPSWLGGEADTGVEEHGKGSIIDSPAEVSLSQSLSEEGKDGVANLWMETSCPHPAARPREPDIQTQL